MNSISRMARIDLPLAMAQFRRLIADGERVAATDPGGVSRYSGSTLPPLLVSVGVRLFHAHG
jgi:hypothetical protein